MGIRERAGKWHWRIQIDGHEYTGSTDLAATKRNESAARQQEAEARQKILAGRSSEIKLRVKPFSDASALFLDWLKGEHPEKPATARRVKVSFASLRAWFAGRAVSSITAGDIEEYKTWRRGSGIAEVTIRHDLHALSLFLAYAKRNHWTRGNPLEEVTIPSDRDAVRMHILNPVEEKRHFGAIDALASGYGIKEGKGAAGRRAIAARQYGSLRDAARLMLLTGARPEEIMRARVEDVKGDWWQIPRGKTRTARRRLRLVAEAKGVMEARVMGAGPSGWLFPGKAPGSHVATFQRVHDAAAKLAKLEIVLYDLRHTFATRAAAAGMPITTLAAVLGHADLRTIMRYVHVRAADIEAGMRLLEPTKEKREEARKV